MSMDKDEVEQLLNIANLSRQWPNLAPIHSAAMAKLEDHAKEAGEVIRKQKEDAMKAVAAKQAEVEQQEKAKWQEVSSQSSGQTQANRRPLAQPQVESSKQGT